MRTSQGICVGVFCACAVLVGELRAQSTFQPYGAWRGHIRYVQGPHRTKEKIRWGGGITPTGGAVLVQAFQSAQAVLTDPNVAGALMRESDAEHRNAFDASIRDLRSTNSQILAELNKVRGKLGLPPIDAAPVNAGGDAGEGQVGIEQGEVTPLADRYAAKEKELADFKASLSSNGGMLSEFAKGLAETMAKGRSALKKSPTESQKSEIDSRLALFASVLGSFNVELPASEKDRESEATFEAFKMDADKIVTKLRAYSNAVQEFATLWGELKAKGTLPPDEIMNRDTKIQGAKDRVGKWNLN